MIDIETSSGWKRNADALNGLKNNEEVIWLNPKLSDFAEACKTFDLSMDDIAATEDRLKRFAPLIMNCFPETSKSDGIIESELCSITGMKDLINYKYNSNLTGRLLLKKDSHLPISGSVKARGGIYEVLKYTEDLALAHNMITLSSNYEILTTDENRSFFSNYTIQVGSTGNLGMSIGIISAAIGYKTIVHMSSDAKRWKKELLRSHGVTVIEYENDYSEAVACGRAESDKDAKSYFVDDENSKNLFLGYAVAAGRLVTQLESLRVKVDDENPLFLYIPCGVGGAPGGITFGAKHMFGNNVHCFFVEPTQACCMVLGMASEMHSDICIQDIGLTGKTHADGLAVGRASGFIGKIMEPILSGIFTVQDKKLYDYMRDVLHSEDLFLEPSACAAFNGPVKINSPEMQVYLKNQNLEGREDNITHVVWATGGNMVPDEMRKVYIDTYI